MAKIKLSGVGVVDIRGKLGGTVFLTGRGGASIRNFAKPTNPQTPSQQSNRVELAALSSNWRSLSETNQLAWHSMATNFRFKGVWGEPLTPAANALYVQLNRNLALVAQPPIDTPAAPEAVIQSETFVITTNTTAAQVLTLDAAVDANSAVVVWATPPISAGQSFFKGKYRIIGTFEASHVAALNTFAMYEAKFGIPLAGSKIAFWVAFINITTGQAGVPLSLASVTS